MRKDKYINNTMESRFNDPLFNKDLGITNDILRPSNSKIYGNEPRYDELFKLHLRAIVP